MSKQFDFTTTIKLHQTDAAGLLFFGRQFDIMHDAYQAMFSAIGFGLFDIVLTKPWLLPIVHAEADYKTALATDEEVTISVGVEKIGRHSFILRYVIRRDGDNVGSGRTVHVVMDKLSRAKTPVPNRLRAALEPYQLLE